MNLLLDTHIWIWSLSAPDRLSRRVARLLTDKRNGLWLSAISVWEALLLSERGRLELGPDSEQWLDKATALLREAPITNEIARRSRSIGLAHADPADRFLAATAEVLDLRLVTADERLLACKDISVIPNR